MLFYSLLFAGGATYIPPAFFDKNDEKVVVQGFKGTKVSIQLFFITLFLFNNYLYDH